MLDVAPEEEEACTHEQAAKELAAVVAARDDFISLIGHELRNAIAPLVMLAEQFEGAPNGIPATRVPMLVRNLRRFVATVDRVTEVAHLHRGKLRLELADVDLVAVITGVVAELEPQATAGRIVFVFDLPATLVGRWDRARIKQIVTNLLTNAIRYTGGGTVEVSARDVDGTAELVVRDHGPGIPADQLAGIFDRFDHPRSRTSGGFGVGLFVVKVLTTAMRGRVGVTNASDGGACFVVTLPRG
jgi:signal transduction histidine kinase